jgi:hypothetical protein
VSTPPGPPPQIESVGELARRMLVAAAGAVVAVGVLGALAGWATGRGTVTIMAATYYVIGCLLFLIGMFPSGGFNMFRGTLTRRRPTGSRQEPIFLLGLVLIGVGIFVDVVRPF